MLSYPSIDFACLYLPFHFLSIDPGSFVYNHSTSLFYDKFQGPEGCWKTFYLQIDLDITMEMTSAPPGPIPIMKHVRPVFCTVKIV